MTEAEWLACTDYYRLLKHLQWRIADRRSRLLGVACCRLALPHVHAVELLSVLGASERFADGEATPDKLRATRAAAEPVTAGLRAESPTDTRDEAWARRMAAEAVMEAASVHSFPSLVASKVQDTEQPRRSLAGTFTAILRDIAGNPFRPVAFFPAWRTDTTVALARQMYEGREFSAMPILADALQDAGCDNADILNHCRGPGPHVRGCWVVDLVLGKE